MQQSDASVLLPLVLFFLARLERLREEDEGSEEVDKLPEGHPRGFRAVEDSPLFLWAVQAQFANEVHKRLQELAVALG